MYVLITCKQVNNPASTAVPVVDAQIVKDVDRSLYRKPGVGKLGTAIFEVNEKNAEEMTLINQLCANPEAFEVCMTTGANGGWYYGYGDVDHITCVGPTQPFSRTLLGVDLSKGGPSLKRSREVTFFKNL